MPGPARYADAASPLLDEQMAEVERVLEEIGAGQIPQVLVFNKLDRLEPSQHPRGLRDGKLSACVSAPHALRAFPKT